MRSERDTTHPVTTPNATCEAMNQVHSMRWFSSGFTTRSSAQVMADMSMGMTNPAARIGRRLNIGRSAA